MKRGFSLVELLVAVTLFTLVVGSVTGLSVAAIRSQAKALVLQKLLDETSYVMEYMSRSIRMAKKDLVGSCTLVCGSYCNYDQLIGSSSIHFINYKNECEGFYIISSLPCSAGVLCHEPPVLPLTSTDLQVFSLQFNLSGQSQNETPNLQPRVTIVMTIKKAGATKPEIKIQTTISQRNLDVQQ